MAMSKKIASLNKPNQLVSIANVLTKENIELLNKLKELEQTVQSYKSQYQELREVNGQLVLSSLDAYIQTDKVESQFNELQKSSQRDTLTGAVTRAFMLECIRLAIYSTKRHKKNIALLFIDLDQFKPVNDQYGHAIGDKVLKHVVKVITSVIRESDTLSRHGGDEFLVLLQDINSLQEVQRVANVLAGVLAEPIKIGERSIQLTASIGVAIYPKDGSDAKTLINCADKAMYRVKKNGGNACSKCKYPDGKK